MTPLSRQYLHSRGITDEVITKYHLGGDDRKIIIPVNGFNKYRTFPEKNYFYDKGFSADLFGIEHLGNTTWCVLTEGELDALRLASEGIPAVSGTGGAATFKSEWVVRLPKHVFVCYDTDKAGKENGLKVHWAIPKSRLVELPLSVKDVSDFLLTNTKEDFEHLLTKSVVISKPLEPKIYRTTKPRPRVENGEDIQKAKSTPITEYIQFRQNKANCIWHEEKTPSLHYYPDTNRIYCFGCNKWGDVIDVVMKQENLNMKDAIQKLL